MSAPAHSPRPLKSCSEISNEEYDVDMECGEAGGDTHEQGVAIPGSPRLLVHSDSDWEKGGTDAEEKPLNIEPSAPPFVFIFMNHHR